MSSTQAGAELLEKMIELRAFDTAMTERHGAWHSSLGEEAVVVGSFLRARPDDVIVSHYRSGALAALLRGESTEQVIEGVLGTPRSRSKGVWRGDIVGGLSQGLLGHMSGSLGTPISQAVGAALAFKQRGEQRVVIATVGDGTMNSGILLESLNLAAVYSVPLVLVCQDNQYACSLRAVDMVRGGIAERAIALGMDTESVDGNDVLALSSAVEGAIAVAREHSRPTFIHALTYRLSGHWVGDPEVYRDADEVETRRRADPIRVLSEHLELSAADIAEKVDKALERRVHEVAELYELAKARLASDDWTTTSMPTFATIGADQ